MVVSIIDRFNRKCQFIFFLFLSTFALYAFTLYLDPVYALCNRVIVGITQVSGKIYNLDVYFNIFSSMDRSVWAKEQESCYDGFSTDFKSIGYCYGLYTCYLFKKGWGKKNILNL
jgi:hypothetical protein